MRLFVYFLVIGFVLLVTQQFAAGIEINTNIPGPNPSAENPGGMIANFYQFALMIGGVLAMGAIVYGGIRYTLAAGSPSAQTEGKEWIKQALYGLLLLVGAYLVLNTINPGLTNLSLPTLETLSSK